MKVDRRWVRTLMASAAIAVAIGLGGCQTEGTTTSTRHLKPLSAEMLAAIEKKSMPKESAILVRIFKQEAELEVWKQDTTGRYALLKTYPICRWSGELGPKVKEGDRQAPEGFYTITPGQMNPNSQFYLSFNLGYPNAFDQAHGRTGAHLMVHGDCSSAGCYAMTDDQIGEIYALGRESFFGGQRAFQVQAYPFRMTAANFAKHRNNPNIPFWKMLKEGNDQFELTGLEPKVDVCEKRYVFNAQPPANATPITRPLSGGPFQTAQAGTTAALKFNPTGRCPAYQIDPEVMAALKDKRQKDQTQIAELIRRGTPVAPIRTGVDGGMHPTFLAKLRPREIKDADGSTRMVVDTSGGKPLGSYVNPPRDPAPIVAGAPARDITASVPSAPAGASGSRTTAHADKRSVPPPARSGNMFTRLFSSDPPPPPAARPAITASKPPAPQPTVSPRPQTAAAPAATPSRQQARPAVVQASAAEATRQTAEPTAAAAASGPSVINGAQPVIPTGSFESRWGAFR